MNKKIKAAAPPDNPLETHAHPLRPELEALPERLKSLPVDERGYPVPWFVQWLFNEAGVAVPEFRAMSQAKYVLAIERKLCWVCGERLGSRMTFVVGPMCGINRISAEPPSHLECAEWSARNCPFLSRPQMVRREGDEIAEAMKGHCMGGEMIRRNPGVSLLWTTRSYEVVPDGQGGALILMGDPEHVMWYREGRAATCAEIEESVRTGLPTVIAELERNNQPGWREELARRLNFLRGLYPV